MQVNFREVKKHQRKRKHSQAQVSECDTERQWEKECVCVFVKEEATKERKKGKQRNAAVVIDK